MAHGALAPIFIVGSIALPGILLWLAVSLVLLMWKKFRLLDWIPIVLSLLLVALLSVLYETWEELMVRIAGPGSHGRDFQVQAAAQDKPRFVTLLLSKGYDINYEDYGGTTPLSGTSVGGHEKMIGFLISRGAEVNRKNHGTGETPLMAAAETGRLGSVKVLLDNGADPCAALSRPLAFLCYLSNPHRLVHRRARAWRVATHNPPLWRPAYYLARMTRGSECRQIRAHWRSHSLHP